MERGRKQHATRDLAQRKYFSIVRKRRTSLNIMLISTLTMDHEIELVVPHAWLSLVRVVVIATVRISARTRTAVLNATSSHCEDAS
jgi:hypothetical protein